MSQTSEVPAGPTRGEAPAGKAAAPTAVQGQAGANAPAPALQIAPAAAAGPRLQAAPPAGQPPRAVAPAAVTPPATRPAPPQPQSAALTPVNPAAAVTPPAARPAPPQPQNAAPNPVNPPAAAAHMRHRHWLLMISFVIMVILPSCVAAWYLWTRAADRYASTVGFSVRREETSSAIDILGGITNLSGSSSSDTDILYEFLKSQKLVSDMDHEVDLRGLWSKPANDPLFAYDATGAIEDLVNYWQRMVQISYDTNSSLIEIRVQAFDPDDSTRIAQTLFEKSSDMINSLNAVAREDAIRYSREELATAVERLKGARQAVTEFRNINQIVDPSTDVQSQAGLLGMLQGQLAEALIEVDLLADSTQTNDPRLTQARRRVEVIKERITAERSKLGIGSGSGEAGAFASVVGEYERLAVDREFAERSYIAAMAAYDAALADARRKSRYLAAHVLPTTAETSRYPERWRLLGTISLFLFLAWSISALVAYSLKDRR